MYIGSREWSHPAAGATPPLLALPRSGQYRPLYQLLAQGRPDQAARAAAAQLVRWELEEASARPCELPDSPEDLTAWMRAGTQAVHARYCLYLEERKAGCPRRYFSNRAHALHFLRSVAPTKLVDGAWLYGLVAHWQNPRFAGLARTYLEELGEGAAGGKRNLL